MKFAEHLGAHVTPEWHKQYIGYDEMKTMIYVAQQDAPSLDDADENTVQGYYAKFEEKFFRFCDKEIQKIDTFFSEKLAEAQRKFASLHAELEHSKRNKTHHEERQNGRIAIWKQNEMVKEFDKHSRKISDIKLAFSEFYLSIILLQNYQQLNFTGFRKILKKYDKVLEVTRGAHFRVKKIETATFFTDKHIASLIYDTEQVYINELEAGNRTKAMKRLRVPPLGGKHTPWTTFRVGLFVGALVILFIVIILSGIFLAQYHSQNWRPALKMYRAMFLVIFFMCLLGINTYGWRKAGVNHVLIFELDPRNHLNHQQIFEVATFFGLIWTLSVLAYLFSPILKIPMFCHPGAMALFMLLYLINPIRILHYRARFWLLRVLLRIITAPFHDVKFADFWLADQLNSLNMVLLDFEFLFCFYAFEVDWLQNGSSKVCSSYSYGVRAIVAALPAWFRFAQCLRRWRDSKQAFPHLANACKYGTTFIVVSLSAWYSVQLEKYGSANDVLLVLWILSAFISSCYTLAWDLKMDWGLLDKNAGENRYLREEIVYPHKVYYYMAMFQDFILRFAWSINVLMVKQKFIDGDILSTFLAVFEVFRRFTWNFFRLENEHLNNCGQFRAVRDISVVPLEQDHEQSVCDMMDADDWFEARQRLTSANPSNSYGSLGRETRVQFAGTSNPGQIQYDDGPDGDENAGLLTSAQASNS